MSDTTTTEVEEQEMPDDPNHGPTAPIETSREEQGDQLERKHEALAPEQDKREPLVNTIEHHGSIFVADIEKVAAATLEDAKGYPVMRRLYADNADGIPAPSMASLLRFYGRSTKPSSVFSGNHGMGLVLANGIKNPAGLVVMSKTTGAAEPYMAWLWKDPDTAEWGLRTFWIQDGAGDWGWHTVTGLIEVDDVDWAEVWKAAYDNNKFNGEPDSGTVIVEIGQYPSESTYYTTQRSFDPVKRSWSFTRWGVRDYYNSRFWTLPIEVYTGIPVGRGGGGSGKPGVSGVINTVINAISKGEAVSKKVLAQPVEFDNTTWEYRRVNGLRASIYTAIADPDDPDATGGTITTGKTTLSGPMPCEVEVYIRELPPGVVASKFNFRERRQGKIFIDYNDEIFEHPDPKTAHAQFGMTHNELKTNVWLRILPHTLGKKTAGGVWMQEGRKDVSVFTEDGDSVDIPWRELGREFKQAMPTELLDYIRKLDSKETTSDELEDKRLQHLWERVAPNMIVKKVRQNVTKKVATAKKRIVKKPGGTPRKTGGTRGPVVNPGETHASGGRDGSEVGSRRRKAPVMKTTTTRELVDKTVPEPSKPKPPVIKWVDHLDDWSTENHWAVQWDDPAPANDNRGKVWLNWNHWYVQQWYDELVNGSFAHQPGAVKGKMRVLFGNSVATKIGHRRKECSSPTLPITEDDKAIIFSPAALTGFVLGVWDHEGRLMQMLGGVTGGSRSAAVSIDDDAVEGDEEEAG
jgi:hypothetical protein